MEEHSQDFSPPATPRDRPRRGVRSVWRVGGRERDDGGLSAWLDPREREERPAKVKGEYDVRAVKHYFNFYRAVKHAF